MNTLRVSQITAQYQMFGDAEPNEWMNAVLETAKTEGKINSFNVLDVKEGPWGIQHITFTVEANLDTGGSIENSFTNAEELLNGIVHDSDIVIEGIELR